MSTTTLPLPSTTSPHVTDRYLFRSLSNDNQNSRISAAKKNKLSNAPPSLSKRYKFSSAGTDQNNNDVYKFPNGQTEQRSHSTDSNRYYFSTDDSAKKPQQTLTYVRSGSGLEQRAVTFIDGASISSDKGSLPTTKSIQPTTIVSDTPYLFSKTTESQRHPSATSSVNPEDAWLEQRQQPHIIFDSITDSSPNSQLKRPRTSSTSPERRRISKHSPTRMDTVTSTNGSLSTLRRSPPTKVQNVRFDPTSTQKSYLSEAKERLAIKKRGRSPQALQQSVDRLVSSTNQKYRQQQIFSPPAPFQSSQQQHPSYISQYYAQEEEPPIDYPMDSDDDEPQKRSNLYNRGLNANSAHERILKHVNGSLLDRRYLGDTNRIKQLEQNAHRYLRFIENQSLQRELNYDLIRCFSSTYLDDLRREENRHFQTRVNMRSYTYEDIQDIHMSQVLEAFKMKRAIDKEKRLRLSASFDGQITSSTPTSSIGAGHLSPLSASYSPVMTGSLNENIDAQSGGFEIDRRSTKSHTSHSQTPTALRTSYVAPAQNLDFFQDIIQESFRGIDASIAGHVSNASQYTKQNARHPPATISQMKPLDTDSDVEIKSNSSFWSDEEEDQLFDDDRRQTIPHQKQLARYLSTVNRSLLDRPSDLIADFYISKLNRGMQDGVRNVESIARDKARMRQNHNREFRDEPTNKLGRSLSAEHLYQVRKEHLRYKQPFNTPTSFTVEDVADIYKPFVLENYKRKIAIELERRRRERQGQLMAGNGASPMYTSDADMSSVLKSSQPPIIELPINAIADRNHRPSNLTQARVVRTNEQGVPIYAGGSNNDVIVVRPPIVRTTDVLMGRAHRTLTDDGNADVVHHIGIASPPTSFSLIKQPTTQVHMSTTSTSSQYEAPRVITVAPPDFPQRLQTHIRTEHADGNVVQPHTSDLIDGPLTSSQQVLYQNGEYDRSLRRPVQIITSSEVTITSTPRPQTKIYTPSPPREPIRICQADRIETASGNYDLSMAKVKPVLTLNQGEIRELNLLAQQAQRLQIPPQDYEHAMIMITPDQPQYQHDIGRQPLLLAAANIGQLHDETQEQVTDHFEPDIRPQNTQLITPIPEHMAKVEQDIAIFENISSTNIQTPSRNRLNEAPPDSGIVSLNTSQASEQPIVLNASRIRLLETSEEHRLEQLREDDYYQRRIRALDLLRQVETDPNMNIQPIYHTPSQVFEHITPIPASNITTAQTRITDTHRIDRIETLEHTDEPVIYETIDQEIVQRISPEQHVTSSDVRQDNRTSNRAEKHQVKWEEPKPIKEHRSQQNQLTDITYEHTSPFTSDPYCARHNLHSTEEPSQLLSTSKHTQDNIVYNYGEKNEVPLSRTSSFSSDQNLKRPTTDSARIEYDRHSLSSLDDITQPVSYHPPTRTQHAQHFITQDIDVEPMALREETAIENEVSYEGSLGRASLRGPIQSLNAPRTLAETNIPALLLEELTTAISAVEEQHATQIMNSGYDPEMFSRIEQGNRVSTVVYDTDWKDEQTKTLTTGMRPNSATAQEKRPLSTEYEQAEIHLPKAILARERFERMENNNQETTADIETQVHQSDHVNESVHSYDDLVSVEHHTNESYEDSLLTERAVDNQEILCRPLTNHLQMTDEHASSLSDDSLHTHHQEKTSVNLNDVASLENPLRSTAFVTLSYPHQNQEINPPWQRIVDEHLLEQYQLENLQLQTEEPSPRYLPTILPAANEQSLHESENYAKVLRQASPVHEYVDIQSTDRIQLVPSQQINRSRPIYRVRQQQVSSADELDYSTISSIHPDHIDQIDASVSNPPLIDTVHIQSPPTVVDIEVRVRPTYSDTSSLPDMDAYLTRFEDTFEPEQHLPLVDQISLSYTTSFRSNQDSTRRAIERYEQEHPYFSRALPTEWFTSNIFPHDEQLVEQWTVEKNLETIQQQQQRQQEQVELRTNTECANVNLSAVTTDASSVGERFEEEKSTSNTTDTTNSEQQINQIASAVITSHCSPTSDYETDSLDKDNDTTSTTTSMDGGLIVATTPIQQNIPDRSSDSKSVDDLIATLENEQKDKTDLVKDLLLTLSYDQHEAKDMYRAKEHEIVEQDDHLLPFNFDDHQRELLNIFFEPAHFHLPLINEISIYQITFHNEHPLLSPSSTLPLAITDHDDHLLSNECKTNQQEILSIAEVQDQSDHEEDLQNITPKHEHLSYIEHYHIQSLHSFGETLSVHIDEPPKIIEYEDEQSIGSILPDVVPSTMATQSEEYIHHEAREVTILPTDPAIEPKEFHSSFDRTETARQSKHSYNLERLSEQKYVEINIATPTPSMRKVRPTPSGHFIEDLSMENTIDTREEKIEYHYIEDRDNLQYASTLTKDHSEHLPPKHLPVEQHPNLERARILLTSDAPASNTNQDDEVLIRDTIVQHISEDEKSTSSEEVVFEEWSEEFRCRRTEVYDQQTHKLLRTTIDETSERVKSDVIKEEYKEKNERIKGHKSYDVVKEVYRRVPAHTVDPAKTTIVSTVDNSQSHLYEEIAQGPSSVRPTPSSANDKRIVIEHKPGNDQWTSEDIYTTEIVYDTNLARDIESSTHLDRSNARFDSRTPTPTPPPPSTNYDRVRIGQYPPIPSANQATISTVPSSNYDRISSIVTTTTTHLPERRPTEREEHVSEEYEVEFERRHLDRRSPFNQHQTTNISTRQGRDETSEEEVSDPYVITGDNTYSGLTTIVTEAGQRRNSDWRQKLKEVYTPTSDDERFDQTARSRETTKKVISATRTDDERPQPPRRSSSSSSIIDDRRTRFEQQQQFDSSSGFSTNVSDRPTFGRVGELKSAFESSTTTSTRDDSSKFRSTTTPGLIEQRRRLFEDQEQSNKEWSPTNRRPVDEFSSNERRMSETHTTPSRVSAIKSTLESATTKQYEPLPVTHTKVDVTIKEKRTISSVDSDGTGASPPIHQSTPKATKQRLDDDAGHESEDELSDPTNKQEQHRRQSKTRLRDFSQSTAQTVDSTYLNQRTKPSFNETNMESILSHVPASKGKGLLIELSPHISHESPITSTATTKAVRDTHKLVTGSDSGIFEYSTATSQQPPAASSSSWRNNVSVSINDDANRSQTVRDSGVYLDSTAGSQRFGRRQPSDTDQTTTHGADDSVSRSTFRYETEIISADQLNQRQPPPRNVHPTTRSPISDYETIANYHSGTGSQRRVPVTTETRTIRPKPLIVDEIETIETETRVECQVQRTHEIKESTTKTERSSSPGAPKKIITTTTTTTTTTAAPTIRSPESLSDEIIRTTTPSKRVLLNERPQYYDSNKNYDSPIAIRSRPESVYTPTKEVRQQTQTYRETGIHEHRLDSPQSDVISYPLPPSSFIQQGESGRVEETWFKPIQHDRSQDSQRQSPSSRSNIRTLSAGPRAVEVTSLSPQNQVTFGKYSPNQIIAIVRVPELSNGNNNARPSPPIRHGTSEPELYVRAKQEAAEEQQQQQQRSRLQYQRVQASSYRPPSITQEYQQRQSRSRTGPYEITNEYSSPVGVPTRSSSYHSALHDQDGQQQQDRDEYPRSSQSGTAYRLQTQRRSGSLGTLLGPNIEFEIEIEKRPPQQPEQPTVVSLDQPTRAIVTSSKDGRVSIRNVAARPGHTLVINSDFHASDRSLNRSSGYFSSEELRSQGLNTNYSSDEQSSGAGANQNQHSQSSNTPSSMHARRYKNNEQGFSKLPSHYRPKQQNHYQQLNTENFDQVNRIVNRYSRQSNTAAGFNDAIDQIDALYNNLDVQTNEDYIMGSNPATTTPPSTYDFSQPTSVTNRRKYLSQNANDYSKRYSSTGFQHVPAQHEQEITTSNANSRHLVSPPTTFSSEKRHYDTHRALSDNENLNSVNEHNRRWGSTSLNDLVMATPIRPSQSLSSSGILADYATPGSVSPNSGFGSTQNVILQQNRLNAQSQIVQRNRTSVKQMKQKSAAKKRTGSNQGQYSDEEDDNDSLGDHDSPLSDTGRPQPPTRSSNRQQ